MQRIPITLAVFAIAATASAQSIATNSPGGKPLSERVVAYTIDAKLNTAQKTLDATETLTYKNLTGQPLSSFPFHLYMNAFRPESSFSRETHAGGGIRDNEMDSSYPKEKLGSIAIAQISADGFGDLTSAMQFTAPDDGNAADHTVLQIALPHAVAPGDSITFHITFHDKFPLSVARNGYKRDFIMGGQWFPKVGVFWHSAWNCHQYHATTEFFADFGTFNVKLTVPQNYVVGASGVPTGSTRNSDGTQTLSYYGEDIIDFAWAASPHFTVTDGTFLSSLGPVKVHVLALASHPNAGQRYLTITKQSLEKFDQWYGPYPYKIITVIDPEPDSEMEGMEYPTLFTAGTGWFESPSNHETELVTEHEFGHQYWYAMVATNEFEEAWLDEGINSYTEVKVLDAVLGRQTSVIAWPWLHTGDRDYQRADYLMVQDYDPVTRKAWQFRDELSYGGITYGKTATALLTLESIIGEETMQHALHNYFMKYRFTHPTGEDFLRTIEDTALAEGKAYHLSASPGSEPLMPASSETTLRPYFNQAIYGTQVLDYAVDSVSSEPADWWRPATGGNYTSTVGLHRKGDFILPVTVEIVFDDGTKLREHWDGVDRWTRFTYTRKARVVSAEIDPDHLILLDKDFFNNSYTTRPSGTAARKLTHLWICMQQIYSQLITWMV